MDDLDFFRDHPPSQVKLNSKNITLSSREIQLDKNGTNTIEIIWNRALYNAEAMFVYCEDIEWIDFSNFDFSQVTSTTVLMGYCNKLKYVNFGNANASEVIYMNYMFTKCYALETVDNFFKTLNVQSINSMFSQCSSLKSLDLSNFYTPFTTDFGSAFEDCISNYLILIVLVLVQKIYKLYLVDVVI